MFSPSILGDLLVLWGAAVTPAGDTEDKKLLEEKESESWGIYKNVKS